MAENSSLSGNEEIAGSYQGLNKFVKLIHSIQAQDFDVLIGVSGFKGFGKTTFSIQVGKHHVMNNLNKRWSLKDYLAWDNENVFDKAYALPEFSPLICDESVRFAMSEDWNARESKRLKKVFTQIRTKHLVTFFNIPDLFWMDRKYREGMMTVWIHLVTKGYAIVFVPDLRPGIDDRWHRKEIKDFMKPYNFFTPIDNVLKTLRRHPCYCDEFAVPKLPADEYASYMKLRDSMVFGEHSGNEDPRNLAGIACYNIYRNPLIFADLIDGDYIRRPTYKWLSDVLMKHPRADGSLITKDSVRRWCEQLRNGESVPRFNKIKFKNSGVELKT